MLTTMLRGVKDMHGFHVRAVDGDLGKVYEFLFDERDWRLRYLVADTGDGRGGRAFLRAEAFGQPDEPARELPVELRRAEASRHAPPGLRATREVMGYRVRASDGEVGVVEDFVVNDADWAVHYIVVETRAWPSPQRIEPTHHARGRARTR